MLVCSYSTVKLISIDMMSVNFSMIKLKIASYFRMVVLFRTVLSLLYFSGNRSQYSKVLLVSSQTAV